LLKPNKVWAISLLFQSRGDRSLNFLTSTTSPTPNNLTPASDPGPMLAKILNSNSCLTPVQLAGMVYLNHKSTDLFIKLNSASAPAPVFSKKSRFRFHSYSGCSLSLFQKGIWHSPIIYLKLKNKMLVLCN